MKEKIKKPKQKPIKLRLHFNENITPEEESKLWSYAFDLLLGEDHKKKKNSE